MDKRHPTPGDKSPIAEARKQLGNRYGELEAVCKQLRAVANAAGDPNSESFGLLIARLDEAAERLRELVEDGRRVLAADDAPVDAEA